MNLADRMRACWKQLDPTDHDPTPSEIIQASALLAEGAAALDKRDRATELLERVERWEEAAVSEPGVMTATQYRKARAALLAYLMVKVKQEDFHGARDCCVDIEILDARYGRRDKVSGR